MPDISEQTDHSPESDHTAQGGTGRVLRDQILDHFEGHLLIFEIRLSQITALGFHLPFRVVNDGCFADNRVSRSQCAV